MAVPWWEVAAQQFEPRKPTWDTPGHLAKATNPKTVQTSALDIIDQALAEAFATPDSRLIITMAPQEGKSVRVAQDFPIWCLDQNPDLRIVTASYGQSLANRNGRTIRNRITSTPAIKLDIANDNGAVHEWQIAGHEGGVLSVGIGAGVTGRAADLMIIDDPIKDRKEADSKTYRDNVWDWWTDAASARLAPGAPVVLILTRWHQDDLAGRLITLDKAAGWKLINIPAQADHKPDLGETDPLGREPGEFMESTRRRTQRQWENRKATAGPRTWAALYQGRPSPEEGGVLPSTWARYEQPLWIDHGDGTRTVPGIGRDDHELVQSWDLTFKDTKSSDYVVGQVWLRVGVEMFLLDMVRRRMNFTETCAAMEAMSAKWPQAIAKFVEDKANGPAVINALSKRLIGLIPIEPEGSKYARTSAVSPLAFSGNIKLPSPALLHNVEELVEEARDFPTAAHDDTVDALSQAANRLLLLPLERGDGIYEPELYELADQQGYSITPY